MKDIYVITGAYGGMGKKCAHEFKNKGILVLCGRNKTKLKEVCDNLNSENVIPIECDTSKKEDILKLYEKIKNLGTLKGILHFAGVSESFNNPLKIMEINLCGTALLTEILSPLFTDKTVVINTSSMTGYNAPIIKEADELMKNPLDKNFLINIEKYLKNDCNLSYYLSKRGVRLFSEACCGKYKKTRFISISPGVILTPMVDDAIKNHPKEIETLINLTPSKRIGKTDDIANLISFLCSDKASFINGVDIRIDGGLIANLKNNS